MEKMKALIKKLNDASNHYYNYSEEIMSNYEYDKLYDELVLMEEETGVVMTNSPTRKVGYTVLSGLSKVRHDSRMLSLDKTKSVEKLKSFLGNETGLLSFKLDGLTIVLKYENGGLLSAITRGNGEIGEDVTHNAFTFKNIPLKIGFKGALTIRGEAVISYDDFKKINDDLDSDKYKNPRNLCSGTVRQLNSEITAKRNVSFLAFSLVEAAGVDFSNSKVNQMKWLNGQGFQTVLYKEVDSGNIEETVKYFEDNIVTSEFASDGLVLTFDSISLSQSLGATSRFPKDSIAFKWADEISETVLRNIDWNTSRTGLINPVAVFDPVELEGTTVNKAFLHNVSVLEALELGEGDRITVYKANMIIPQIAGNLTRSGTAKPPGKCPECGGDTEIVKLREGKALKCTNPNCMAQLIRALSHFVSRDAMNIEGVSEAILEKFVDNGFINNYTDLFELDKYKEEIIALEGFGEKSYNNLIEAIERSKHTALPNFINALGINNVGLSNSKLLCNYFDNRLDKIMSATKEELINIEGFGEVIADSVSKYFSSGENAKLVMKAVEYLNIPEETKEQSEKPLSGMSFVVTGDVSRFKNRKELQAEIEKFGGKVTGSVSGKTNYLINNDAFSDSAKNKKAKELGIPIITEEEFNRYLIDGIAKAGLGEAFVVTGQEDTKKEVTATGL